MKIEKDKFGMYNIFFDTVKQLIKDMPILSQLMIFRRFTIWVRPETHMDEDYECIATVFCNNILIDKKYDKIIGDELSINGLPYRYF